MASIKYDLPMLDYKIRFLLWQVKMRAILAQTNDLDEALEKFGKKKKVIRTRLCGTNNFAQSFTVQLSTKQVSEISSILLNVPLNSTKQQQNNQVAVKGHTTAGINILILIGTRD